MISWLVPITQNLLVVSRHPMPQPVITQHWAIAVAQVLDCVPGLVLQGAKHRRNPAQVALAHHNRSPGRPVIPQQVFFAAIR